MIVRLAAVTILLALFAVGFASLVEHDNRTFDEMTPRAVAGCYDRGAVCPPSRG